MSNNRITDGFPEQSVNDVRCKGDQLDAVLWQGKQWAVTTYGIECRKGTYHIDAKRVVEKEASNYTWVQHMAEKPWVDIDDFQDALTAFSLLFTKNGERNTRAAPRLLSQEEIEDHAIMQGDLAYQEAKSKALRGEL